MGPHRQDVPLRDRRGERDARRPLPRAIAAAHLSLHVRARVHGGVPVLLVDRRRVRRLRRPPGEPRRHADGGVAGAAAEAAGLQDADGVAVPVGVIVRRRLQRRLQRSDHRGAAAHGRRRIQLPARVGVAVARRRRPRRPDRGDDRHRPCHVHARAPGPERVRARGRRPLSRVFHLRARPGQHVGHVPAARPRPARPQRDGRLVAPPRRVQPRLEPCQGWPTCRCPAAGRCR